MAHHGPFPWDGDEPPPWAKDEPAKLRTFKTQQERLRELLDTTGFRGALGEFPEGKLTKQDEGAIRFAIGSKGDKVILDFGSPVHWVGMTAQQAADLASSLLSKAREVGRRNGETVTLTIGE